MSVEVTDKAMDVYKVDVVVQANLEGPHVGHSMQCNTRTAWVKAPAVWRDPWPGHVLGSWVRNPLGAWLVHEPL